MCQTLIECVYPSYSVYNIDDLQDANIIHPFCAGLPGPLLSSQHLFWRVNRNLKRCVVGSLLHKFMPHMSQGYTYTAGRVDIRDIYPTLEQSRAMLLAVMAATII